MYFKNQELHALAAHKMAHAMPQPINATVMANVSTNSKMCTPFAVPL